jgi:ribosome-associated heat shock protein Hsp15
VELTRTRVDKWLWAVRVYPTRTAATNAVDGGHVDVNGSRAKPATAVQVGDRVHARVGEHRREYEVVRVIDKRVGAPIAVTCFVDHSPPPPPREEYVRPLFVRDRATGRPTKRERRQLDRFRGSG